LRNSSEQRARRHYRLRCYRILGANVWIGGYEIDLVVRRGRALAFVEVKSKSGDRVGDPLEMVGAEKKRRLRQAAEAWLAAHPDAVGLEARFDVVAVRDGRLERLSSAF
jgi:putative endonuclease